MLRKGLVLFLVVAMTLTSVLGCASGTATTAPATEETTEATAAPVADDTTAKKVVSIGIPMDIGSVAPFGAMDGGRAQLMHMIYEPMIQRIKFGAPVAEMALVCAKSVTAVDPATYDIEMYDYIYDAAGNHITADDYVWSATQMQSDGKYPKLNSALASITKTGDYSVEMKFNNPSLGDVEWVLSMVPVISKAAYEASGDDMTNKPVTTAMYQLDSFTSGSGAVLVKNPNYWQTDESLRYAWAVGNADEIDFKIIKESSQMTIALKSGDIDIAGIDASSISEFYDPATSTAKDGYTVAVQLQTMVIGILFNANSASILSDNLKLRQAICYAINKDDIVALACSGLGQPLNAFANPWAADYNPDWDTRDYYNYSVEKATQAFAESGAASGTELTLLCNDNEQYVKAAQVVQAQLAEIGITLNIKTADSASYESISADPTQWDLQITGRGCDDFCTFPWSLLFNQGTFAWEGTFNFITDPVEKELYTAATGLTTHSRETVDAFEQYLDDNAWAFGLFTNYNFYVANTNVITEIFMREGGEPIVGACTLK